MSSLIRSRVPVLVDGVLPGDRLLQVDSVKAEGATMGTVIDALRGAPGDVRVLVLRRDEKDIQVKAVVHRFL